MFFFFFYLKAYAYNNYGVRFLVQATACGLTLSIAGWIADVRSGRYKAIKLSMLVMWAAIMLTTMSSVLARVSLVPRPIPSFSMFHAEKREGLVYVCT